MSEKRTKADKEQRQADQLEKKARHPAAKKKKAPRGFQPSRCPDRARSYRRKMSLKSREPSQIMFGH